MEEMNWIPIIVATLIPTVLGMIYYSPGVLGNVWMRSIGKTAEEMRDGFNMPVAIVLGLVLGFFLAFGLNAMVELTHKEVSEAGELVYGSHHTFGHGALHGFMYAIMFMVPPLVMNGMYARKSWTTILIHVGYWILCFALMSGLMDAWN